ncbi:Uncharacterised protein [Mycobacterium tuberculosis]|nr:Uncharacterised protein [Mycobacterium tuberculosis]COW25048.1 Uncharacterised protein [Mycobacterium tuberculosis]
MFCGGTSPGPVNPIGVCAMAAPMAALATANRLSGRSGKSLKPSYAVTTWLVSYWLSTCWGIVYSMKGIGMWLPGGKIRARKLAPNA